MGLFDIFKRKTPGTPPRIGTQQTSDNQPIIKSARDAKAFFLGATKDERLAQFLVAVAEKVGRDGYLVVEPGGDGQPYSAEYPNDEQCSAGNRGVSQKECQTEYQRLRQQLAMAQSDAERDAIDRQIAELVWGIGTIRVNVSTTQEFERQRGLILETWQQFKVIVRSTHDSNS
ncbi:MAG: hypothetical protein WCO56_15400 [Verrucomicrobiota bacterium]